MSEQDLTRSIQEMMAEMAAMRAELNNLKQRTNILTKSEIEPEQPAAAKPVLPANRRKVLRRLAGGLLAGVGMIGVAASLPGEAEAKISVNPTSQNNRIGAIITTPGDTTSGTLYNDGTTFKYGMVVLGGTGNVDLSVASNVTPNSTGIFARGGTTGVYGTGQYY